MIPLDKGKPNKNEISNYRPVSVLYTFLKFYEKVIKKQLVRFMEEYFSPMTSAYRTNYSSGLHTGPSFVQSINKRRILFHINSVGT